MRKIKVEWKYLDQTFKSKEEAIAYQRGFERGLKECQEKHKEDV